MRSLVVLSSLLSVAVAATPPPPADADFAGAWWGTLDTGAAQLRLVLDLRRDPQGWTGELVSVDQGTARIRIDRATIDGETVALELRALHATFAGKRADGQHIRGTFTQGPVALPLELHKGTLPPARMARPQEPKPPYPYAIEEVAIDRRAAGLALGCTLTHPRARGFPVVVTITGSGQQDRDETIRGHKPFWVLADALSRRGVGVLRCDDRGKNGSTGNFASSTTFDFADDVEAELAWLKTRSDVDRRHLGLLGHSEGGIVAAIVASRSKDVAFVVLLAGPALRGDAIIVDQVALAARAQGATEERIAALVAFEKRILDIVEAEKVDTAARAQLRAVSAEPAFVAQIETLVSPWYRTFLTLDPKPYLQKLQVPLLALDGARDIQVPAGENIAALRQALTGKRDITLQELPGLNHLFQTCTRCTVEEYEAIDETIAPAVVQLVVDWVAKHALAAGAPPGR
jgi:pimeloyl-ACP methyl ester carboxylesterase